MEPLIAPHFDLKSRKILTVDDDRVNLVRDQPLRYDGLKKVLLGLTTIDEIEHSTSFEWAT